MHRHTHGKRGVTPQDDLFIARAITEPHERQTRSGSNAARAKAKK
jgi:hypothetical protein